MGDPRTWASRVLVLGWAFLVVIMVHLFTGGWCVCGLAATRLCYVTTHTVTLPPPIPPSKTATTASKLTMQRLANDISDKSDLPGKAVESWEPVRRWTHGPLRLWSGC